MEELVQQTLSPGLNLQESNSEEINKQFIQQLEQNTSFANFNEKLLASRKEGALERILIVSKYFQWVPLSPETISKYSKHPGLSSQLREKANAFFRAKNYPIALRSYNLAIMFSPSNNENLGLAFANRSATLLAMGKASQALQDIELAFAHNYPGKLSKKLEERRDKCNEILKQTKDEEESELHLQSLAEKKRRQRFCDGILFRVKKPNPRMISAEEFVQVQFHPTNGRRLIVNRDIPAGTVLIVEKPFVSILKDLVKWEVSHCHYCLRKILRGIPCQGCVFAIYCNKSCLEKAAEEYHAFECPCMAYLHCNATPRYLLLALRIICKLGPDKLKAWRNFILQKESNSSSLLEKYDSDSYEPIYHLVSHSSQMDPMNLYTQALNALIVTTTLRNQSKFFETADDKVTKEIFFKFVASMILHHVENIPFNSISIDEVEGLENLNLHESLHNTDKEDLATLIKSIQFSQFAAGVYGVSSLMNHSCDPNVTRVAGLENGTLAIVATRSLKINEEILTCYSQSFTSDEIHSRRNYLSENYFFHCNCIACRNNWPQLSALMKKPILFTCRICSGNFLQDMKDSKEFKKCTLRASDCSLCGNRYSQDELGAEFNRNAELFFQAYRCVLANDPLAAIRTLIPALKYFQTCTSPPYSKAYLSQDVYKQALETIVYFSS